MEDGQDACEMFGKLLLCDYPTLFYPVYGFKLWFKTTIKREQMAKMEFLAMT